MYVKNTGATAITLNDLNLTTSSSTYSLKAIIKTSTASYNPDGLSNIYFYWDNPPQDVARSTSLTWRPRAPALRRPRGRSFGAAWKNSRGAPSSGR